MTSDGTSSGPAARLDSRDRPLSAIAVGFAALGIFALSSSMVGDGTNDAVVRALRAANEGNLSELLAIPPRDLESILAGDIGLTATARTTLSEALVGTSAVVIRPTLENYLVALDRARIARVSAGRGRMEETRDLLDFLLLDRPRFIAEEGFRHRLMGILEQVWDRRASAGLRDILLSEFGASGALSYPSCEVLQAKWGAVPRLSESRRETFESRAWTFPSDDSGIIRASIYSLPSSFFSVADAERFLAAVRRAAPKRRILVFSDLPLSQALAPVARRLGVRILETYGWGYTPWTRDTFSLLRSASGGLLALARPPGLLQSGRERDREMARELIKDLPDDLDGEWSRPAWATSPVPFHNGMALLTPAEAWITLHSLEPRILAILGIPRVPVASFSEAKGIDAYLEAARTAAAELERFYRRRVRWVHPLPETGTVAQRTAEMDEIGGGAGFDLDSYVTFLPADRRGKRRALVADVGLGSRLFAESSSSDRAAFASGYGLEASSDLARIVSAYQASPRAARFGRYLDLVATGLTRESVAVSRVPILLVPVELLHDREGTQGESDFLVTWNNVVVQSDAAGTRAEGFSGLLPIGDRAARAAFAAFDCRLSYLPPLVRSVTANGGYRCASNHLRTLGR